MADISLTPQVPMTGLTYFLKEAGVAQFLNENFTRPKVSIPEIKIPPGGATSYSQVGIAYDYWVRCSATASTKRADRNNTNRVLGSPGVHTARLVAAGQEYYPPCRDQDDLPSLCGDHLFELEAALREGADLQSEKLLEALLFFARFDAYYRSGVGSNRHDTNVEDYFELRSLILGSDLSWLQGKVVQAGPVLGVRGSVRGIGADGDLLVDKTLIDIKCVKAINIKDNLRQLISYWALSVLGKRKHSIERVGAYYPRYDLRVEFAIDELMTPEQQARVLEFFRFAMYGALQAEEAA